MCFLKKALSFLAWVLLSTLRGYGRIQHTVDGYSQATGEG